MNQMASISGAMGSVKCARLAKAAQHAPASCASDAARVQTHFAQRSPRGFAVQPKLARCFFAFVFAFAALAAFVYTPVARADADKVIFFATDWCPYCKQARAYMQRKNVDYIEKDIEKDPAHRAEYDRHGGKGVPLFVMGDKTQFGFTPRAFDEMYAAFRAERGLPKRTDPPRTHSTQADMKSGDVLIGKIPGVAVYADEKRRMDGIRHKLAKREEVTYLGEERNGALKVKTAQGEGWVVKYYMQKP
jgi:glutaredoxin